MLVFYRSDRPRAIIKKGFQDNISIRGEDSAVIGCLFSTDPFDESIRANGCIVLFLDIPGVVFNQYVRPIGMRFGTAVIPAKVANQYGPAKLLTYKSAVLLSRLIKAKRCLHSHTEPLSHLSSLTSNLLFEEQTARAEQTVIAVPS